MLYQEGKSLFFSDRTSYDLTPVDSNSPFASAPYRLISIAASIVKSSVFLIFLIG